MGKWFKTTQKYVGNVEKYVRIGSLAKNQALLSLDQLII